jgi:TrmH family RNA methyltransferase
MCIIGNEGNGVSKEIIEKCSDRITIKMDGRAESLNAAAAASIIMWEMAR